MSKVLFQIRIRNLIGAMGISQERFADLVGITPAAASQLISGKREPSFNTLDKIHMKIGADVQYLMGHRLGDNHRKRLEKERANG